MNGDNAASPVGKDDVQRDKRVEHPEAERLRRLEDKEHALVHRQRRALHEPTRPRLDGSRQFSLDRQKHRPRGGPYHLNTCAREVGHRWCHHSKATEEAEERGQMSHDTPPLPVHPTSGKPAPSRRMLMVRLIPSWI